MLEAASHGGLLVLSVRQAAVSEGARTGFLLMAPSTFGRRRALTVAQYADEGQ